MCEPLYPAEAAIIMQSKYDGHFWMITTSKKVKKLTLDELLKEMDGCYNSTKLTICLEKGTMFVWSRNGLAAVGVLNADVFDESIWCNLEKLAEIVKDKLPEPILPSDIEAAYSEMRLILGIGKTPIPTVA